MCFQAYRQRGPQSPGGRQLERALANCLKFTSRKNQVISASSPNSKRRHYFSAWWFHSLLGSIYFIAVLMLDTLLSFLSVTTSKNLMKLLKPDHLLFLNRGITLAFWQSEGESLNIKSSKPAQNSWSSWQEWCPSLTGTIPFLLYVCYFYWIATLQILKL